jgi:hypothetical protein
MFILMRRRILIARRWKWMCGVVIFEDLGLVEWLKFLQIFLLTASLFQNGGVSYASITNIPPIWSRFVCCYLCIL